MNQVAREANRVEDLVRVYLVPADGVATFHDLLREARAAAVEDSTVDEIDAWTRVGEHVEDVFSASKVVRARFT